MLGFGALGEFALGDYGTDGAATLVGLPAVVLTFSANAPGVLAGKKIGLPAAGAFTFANALIGVRGGKNVALPPVTYTFGTRALWVGISAWLKLPPVGWVFANITPTVRAGKHISLHGRHIFSVDGGALGEGALGEYAIGQGEPFTVDARLPVGLFYQALTVSVIGGKNLSLPAEPYAYSAKPIEVGARRRKLKIFTNVS